MYVLEVESESEVRPHWASCDGKKKRAEMTQKDWREGVTCDV